MVLVYLILLGLYVWSILWGAADAGKRGKSGFLAALLIALLAWPISLIVWLLFRGEERGRQDDAIASGYRGAASRGSSAASPDWYRSGGWT
jgi:hypothetical protein